MASPNAQKDTGKAEARFKSLDKDNNGSLSKEEFEAGQKKKN
jgi:Ca2+-binding EF-hand superfamily protein